MATQLKVSDDVRRSLTHFVDELLRLYRDDLVSVMVFGSAVSGGFAEQASDVNVLVVYSDLNIADLDLVAKLAQEVRKHHRFTPRFLSLRNLTSSLRYFQIDFLEMRDAHFILHGRDLVQDLKLSPADLHWQIAHEVKRLRMRLKQQYWMAAGDPRMMREVITKRFSSVLHLMRAYLLLTRGNAPVTPMDILDQGAEVIGFDRSAAEHLLAARHDSSVLRDGELTRAFTKLMDLVRTLDEHNDRAL